MGRSSGFAFQFVDRSFRPRTIRRKTHLAQDAEYVTRDATTARSGTKMPLGEKPPIDIPSSSNDSFIQVFEKQGRAGPCQAT
jgi:hypothetical protein